MSVSRIILSPSRYDRSPESLLRAVKKYILGCDTIALTEVASDKRVRRLRFIPNWRFCSVEGPDGRNECAILSKRSKWKVTRIWVERLSDTELTTRGNQRVWALCVERHLRLRPSKVVIDMAVHFPAHHHNPQQMKAWNESIARAGELARKWIGEGKRVRMSADVNKNWRNGGVRITLGIKLSPMRCNWQNRMPTHGTHGTRVIDHIWSNMVCEHTHVMEDDDSSDHRPSKARHRL